MWPLVDLHALANGPHLRVFWQHKLDSLGYLKKKQKQKERRERGKKGKKEGERVISGKSERESLGNKYNQNIFTHVGDSQRINKSMVFIKCQLTVSVFFSFQGFLTSS